MVFEIFIKFEKAFFFYDACGFQSRGMPTITVKSRK
jgi:hypothetical protein